MKTFTFNTFRKDVLVKSGTFQFESLAKAEKKRNSLQAFWDSRYPDLGYHVQVVELISEGPTWNLYAKNGEYRTTTSIWAEVEAWLAAHEDNTYVEVN